MSARGQGRPTSPRVAVRAGRFVEAPSSYEWMHGYAFEFLSILHAATVIFTLLWLPFGKFFHIFQRPAQLGVSFYRDAGRRGEQAHCRRCGDAFASRIQVEDLIRVERELGYRYELRGEPGRDPDDRDHYQWVCPRCRRALLALSQGETVAGGCSKSTSRASSTTWTTVVSGSSSIRGCATG